MSMSFFKVLWEAAYALSTLLAARLTTPDTAGPPRTARPPAPRPPAHRLAAMLSLPTHDDDCGGTDPVHSTAAAHRKHPDVAPTVCELGAGCGLVGLTLARLGCDVVLTEVDQPLPTLRANVARNFNGPASTGAGTVTPRVERLVWGCEADIDRVVGIPARGSYDAVVASDVNHDPDMVRRDNTQLSRRDMRPMTLGLSS